ncbi:phosphatase PAP2 family protein [Arthrobacter caoxuetaonis]|uniref:phosphatase PAP2 family protein n=1 Tax=Arthrobacter caoxuetaonis TaxID=2886935 RepID=UPI001D15806C|nr:phosphatase PAP2 family protein [Arthrobacter caoxuetaonis]MCC3281319.1 phosphatase PAP2 family protein [Arthrobacter caoxuetaonis]
MDTRNLLNRRAPAKRRAGHNPALFLFAALLAAACTAVTYLGFVRTTTGQLADESAWREAEAVAPSTRYPALEILDFLPLLSAFIALAVIVAVSISRRRFSVAVIAIATMAGANLATQLLKNLLLDRPYRGVITLDFNSLPSGHTTMAASAMAAVFLVSAPRWRPAVAALGGTYAVLAGAATFFNLWHRPADVVAAFLVVAACTLVGGLVMMRTNPEWNTWPAGGRSGGRFWTGLSAIAGALALAVSLALYAYATWGSGIALLDDKPLYFAGGLALVVGTGYVIAALGSWLFSQQAGDR